MENIHLNTGITLHYQDQGKRAAPVIIMIMGLGAQMTVWPDALYHGLVNKGFRVIRFDNRDSGLSTHLDHHGQPSILKAWLSKKLPIKTSLPYQLDDMANDVTALMKALKIKKAHLVGASMGGLIAQLVAAKHKKKVLSLTTIMSGYGAPKVNRRSFITLVKLAKLQQNCTSREAAIQYNIKLNQLIGSPAYPQDSEQLYEHALKTIERAHNPHGFKRQLAAISASKPDHSLLKQIKAPTLVIHGNADPLMPLKGGQHTAEQIKKAKLKVIKGMGHNFPPQLSEKFIKLITKHVRKAERKRQKKKSNKAKPETMVNYD